MGLSPQFFRQLPGFLVAGSLPALALLLFDAPGLEGVPQETVTEHMQQLLGEEVAAMQEIGLETELGKVESMAIGSEAHADFLFTLPTLCV